MEGVEPDVAANGRYRIDEKIGEAEVGSVFAAWDAQLKRRVAIKRLPQSALNTVATREQVLKEAHLLASLMHPNLVPIADVANDSQGSFASMDFVDGENLHEVVHRSVFIQRDFVTFARQLLSGLEAAHQAGLLHCDLKPGNVMLNWKPDSSFEVKILNFGLARLTKPAASELPEEPAPSTHSIHAAAPERFSGESLDARADLYSAGCIFYYVLTGKFPFVGETVGQVMTAHREHTVIPLEQYRPDLQVEICRWVMQLISRNPAERPASAKAADALLMAIVEGPRLRSPRKGPVAMVPKEPIPEVPAKRRTKAGIFLLLILLVGGGVAAAFWWQAKQEQTRTDAANAAPTPPQADPTDPLDSVAKPEAAPLIATQFMNPAAPTEVLQATDVEGLRKLMGKQVIVQGKVTGKAQNKAGTIDYLNFTEDYRDSASLVFFHRPTDPPQPAIDLAGYVGHMIRADGVLTEHRGTLQIAIRNVSQISVVD